MHGWAGNAYSATHGERRVFIKINVFVQMLRRVAELGIIPPILACGELEGYTYIIQEYVAASYPEHWWFASHMSEIAALVRTYQQDEKLLNLLTDRGPTYLADDFSRVNQCYDALRAAFHDHVGVSRAYANILAQLPAVRGAMCVPTHGDISRKNFLLTSDRILLVDWDEASPSDPMRDIGPLLWWYVPPPRWENFFQAYGQTLGDAVLARLYWWTARMSLEEAYGLLEHGYREHALDFVADFMAAAMCESNPHAQYER